VLRNVASVAGDGCTKDPDNNRAIVAENDINEQASRNKQLSYILFTPQVSFGRSDFALA
jgi:hypothetical protein